MKTLEKFQQEYELIFHLKINKKEREKRLANLMSELEKTFTSPCPIVRNGRPKTKNLLFFIKNFQIVYKQANS